MDVSAGQRFAVLEDGPSSSKWVPVIRHAEWTSPKRLAQGTARTVTLMGGIRLDEVSWAWEPQRRIGFCVTRTNNLRWRMATPTCPGGCGA